MVTTVQLSGNFGLQDGTEATNRTVIFTLSGIDHDGQETIEPKRQVIDLDANGEFSGAMLWPNSRGVKGTTYKVELGGQNGTAPRKIFDKLYVAEGSSTLNLAELIALGTAAGQITSRFVSVTQAQYQSALAAGTLIEGALYLVEISA